MALRSLSLLLPFAAAFLAAAVACTHTETSYVDVDDDSGTKKEIEAGPSAPPADSGLGVLSFKPASMNSGFDGQHTFKVPFAVYDSGDDLEVTASDAALATFVPVKLANPVSDNGTDLGKYYMVTVKGAGDITFTATSRGKSATGTLHVVAYDAASYGVGEARYTMGAPDSADGKKGPPCTDCHVNGKAVDHSPAALATVNDSGVRQIITTGLSASGHSILIDGKPHRWAVADDSQLAGLVTYLRALEPKGFK